MSNTISINTTKLLVLSVSVYQSDRAEVRRIIPVELKTGQNEVCIERLPNLDKDSIRVEGLGNAVIFDVIYTAPPPRTSNLRNTSAIIATGRGPCTPEEEALIQTNKNIEALKAQKQVLEDQATMLADYSKTLTADKADVSKLVVFLGLYEQRKRKVVEGLRKAEEDLEQLEKVAQEQRAAAMADDASKKRGVKITVIVLAEEDGPAELSLWYVVYGASWTPLYDVRAQIDKAASTAAAPKSSPLNSNSIKIHYRASISQSTGEDWTDVDLTLSTASPTLGTEIPTLYPYRIALPSRMRAPSASYKKEAAGGLMSRSLSVNYSALREVEDDEGGEEYGSPIIQQVQMTVPSATAVEGATSSTFVISGKSSIPSDPDQYWNRTSHKVSIAEIDLEPKLEWIAVPKKKASIFLRSTVKNNSPYILLPGTSNIFMDGNFVCKSSIPSVSPQETFSLSLGVDPSIRITYHPLVKSLKASSGSAFSLQAKTDTTSHIQRISIKNTRQTLTQVLVKDHIPITDNADFKVTLVEPAQLRGNAKDWAPVASSVKARWVPKRDEDEEGQAVVSVSVDAKSTPGADVPGEDGMVEWACDVGAGKSVDVTLAWGITAPHGRTWVDY